MSNDTMIATNTNTLDMNGVVNGGEDEVNEEYDHNNNHNNNHNHHNNNTHDVKIKYPDEEEDDGNRGSRARSYTDSEGFFEEVSIPVIWECSLSGTSILFPQHLR